MSDGSPERFEDAVREKAERMARARRERSSLFRTLAHASALGWLLILPVVLGAAAGRVAERSTGHRGLTVVGLVAGLALGALLTVKQVRRALEDEEEAT